MAVRDSIAEKLFSARQTEEAAKAAKAMRSVGTEAQKTQTQVRSLSRGYDTLNTKTQGMSRSLRINELSWGAVGQSVANAALKVALWTVATTAVIGVVRKVSEVIDLWKNLEVTLARIGITTSTLGKDLYQYFTATADVAQSMGMPIQETLRGMDLALRATARLGDETKRTAVATLMLRDAAILGNVAGMNFDQAIDILVGSLRQTGMELD